MSKKLLNSIKSQLSELETFVQFTAHDDTKALENFSAILALTITQFENVKIDERERCAGCCERKDLEEMANDEYCFACERENEQIKVARSEAYQDAVYGLLRL